MTHLLMTALLLGCPSKTEPGTSDSSATATPPTFDTALTTPTDAGVRVDTPARTSDLFGDARYPALRVVLHYRQGAAPGALAMTKLREALADLEATGHVVKPAGIRIELGKELPPTATPGGDYTFEELDADLEGVRGSFVVGDAAVIHGLYTDGSYDNGGEGTVLGFAYGGARMVMMRDRIDDACDDPVLSLLPGGADEEKCATLEATVLLHELGHLFGLVNNGLPMVTDHQDPDHGAHDEDDDCLMYWAAETPAVADTIADAYLNGDGKIPSFDAQCLADMAAALD
jgi:hypothetical protein